MEMGFSRNSYIKGMLPFLFLGLCLLIFHFLVPIPVGDDIFFKSRPNGIFDIDFFVLRYNGWSSRIIIEFFTVLFLKLPNFIWRIINPIIIVLLSSFISKIFVYKNTYIINWLIVFLFLIYPLREMLVGGYITISLNYFWPLTFGFYSLVQIKKIINGEHIKLIDYIISLLLLIIAFNQEVIAGIMLLIYCMTAGYLIRKKKMHWYIIVCLIMCFISLAVILLSPGNAVRSRVETRGFVDFHFISLIEKIEIGVSSTFAQYALSFSLLYFILCLFLYLRVSTLKQNLFVEILSLIPLVFVFVFGNILYPIVGRIYPHMSAIDPFISKYGFITLGNFTEIRSYIPYFISYIIFLVLFLLVFISFTSNLRTVALMVFVLGLLSRFIMAFSPTVWASGFRTHFLLNFSFVIIIIMLFQELIKNKSLQFINNLIKLCGFIAVFSYINAIMAI